MGDDAILVTSLGSVPVRAGRSWRRWGHPPAFPVGEGVETPEACGVIDVTDRNDGDAP